jgi:KRAB domain-containing zinc finger protein
LKVYHLKMKPFRCMLCQKDFGLNSDLQIHIERVHEQKKRFQCELCKFTSFHHIDLRRHIECVHEKMKPFKCNICLLEFGLKGNMLSHKNNVHLKIVKNEKKIPIFSTGN